MIPNLIGSGNLPPICCALIVTVALLYPEPVWTGVSAINDPLCTVAIAWAPVPSPVIVTSGAAE